MICVYLCVLVLFLFLMICSRRESVDETVLNSRLQVPFLKAAAFLYKKSLRHLPSHGKRKTRVMDDLKILYRTAALPVKETEYILQKSSTILMVMLVGTLLAFCLSISSRMEGGGMIADIERQTYGGGSKTVSLQAAVDTDMESGIYEELEITVKEREYTREEAMEWIEKAIAQIPDEILGENRTLSEVRTDLTFVTSVSDNPVAIAWESGDYRLLDDYGHIMSTEIAEEGELCQVTAHVSYRDYAQELTFYVRICPMPVSYDEILRRELQEALEQQELASRTGERMELPKEVGGQKVNWSQKTTDNSVIIILLAALVGILIPVAMDRDLHGQVVKRQKELIRAYPELISKFTLLMSAGMSVRMIFYKLAADKRRQNAEKKGKQKEKSPGQALSEELQITCNELDGGVSEAQAYMNFGKRCGEQHYIKFSTLLTQNLKKGTTGLVTIMNHEAKEAFSERKSDARRLGEEAGTKLLLPMMLMLLVVMIMIMVPAFLSFSV